MKQSLPLIGVPCRNDVSATYRDNRIYAQSVSYASVISKVGGIPFFIPLNLSETALKKLYHLANGLLLAGGGDITPGFFNQPAHPTISDVQPDRDEAEMTLCRWAVADKKPLLGICRGMQVMAVAVGGDLIQDLPSERPQATLHKYSYEADKVIERAKHLVHTVELTPTSRLSQCLQTNMLRVNSLHHQAVKHVPKPFQIVGYADDGVVEAFELPDHPFFCGVQWHPEALFDEQETARKLFISFINAC